MIKEIKRALFGKSGRFQIWHYAGDAITGHNLRWRRYGTEEFPTERAARKAVKKLGKSAGVFGIKEVKE